MNRRTPTKTGFRNHPNPDGPVDHDVPVLQVQGADRELEAVLFGYACYSTTLSFYRFCGDYSGFAKRYLEQAHPGMVALFLANGVEAALETQPRAVRGPLRMALDEVVLEFAETLQQPDELLPWEALLRLGSSVHKADFPVKALGGVSALR